jgi:transposase
VVEVNRPDRARRRRKGKTDPVDAEAAARAVLAGDARAVPKDRNGAVGELRALVVARRSAIKARTQATNQIRALLVDGDDELRGRLRRLGKAHLAGRALSSPHGRAAACAGQPGPPLAGLGPGGQPP